ncbi:septum formation initiator family protein [Alicyclobacillus dauci]|uniref:Septum formation initiator family protein n=1 Tax=Alicyclobacillus dauci TaxID=1475485 RepID=A0ABY6Z5P2_9BACL|nr:septum formation initiator family protein [Alicyclobacillus dauci]WAH37340.1 septum formation initiator family protein [Alicyclobacillus dauci]
MHAYRQLGKPDVGPHVTSRRKNPLLRVRYLALVIICGWAALYYLHTERPQLMKLQLQHQQLQSQLSQMKAQQQSLEQEKQQLNDPSYIEKYASKHDGMSAPGQIPFDLQQGSPQG